MTSSLQEQFTASPSVCGLLCPAAGACMRAAPSWNRSGAQLKVVCMVLLTDLRDALVLLFNWAS